ncbi:MAG TPA: glycoside hydrolase family 15 protein [Actinospica sp.]|nr:glycoside hydrolase family 15 protein [Actinospica sp.]
MLSSARRHRGRPYLRTSLTGLAMALAAVTLSTHGSATSSPHIVPAADTTTLPSTTSSASEYINNWSNLTAVWNASKLNQDDTGTYGPRIAELRAGNQWSTNQIVDYTGFFDDATDSVKYDQAHDFASTGYLDENGVLNTTYGNYNSSAMPITVKRDYVMVPNEPFLVVRYTLTNPSPTSSYSWKVLDQVHLNNTSSSTNVSASYDSTRNAMFGNMTASGQDVVTLGALQSPTAYQVGNDSDTTASDTTASAWAQFDGNGTLDDNASESTPNVDLGFQNTVSIAPSSSQTLYYYLGLGTSLSAAQSAADTARAQTGAYWFNTTATDYANWLASGTKLSTTDTGVNTAYERNLVVIKNSQNPTNGLIPAATNEGSYGYKAWMRDSAFDAMALDASGHYAEAEKFWDFMIANQLSTGAWHTTYDEWSGTYVSFVEPEYDSIGEFLVGVLKHYQDTGSSTFLSAVWPAVQSAANFIQNNIASNGLGAPDNSIWEENFLYQVFTQAYYVAGLHAAAVLAHDESASSTADGWNGAASTILSAVQRSDSASPPGLWNAGGGYYDRGIATDGTTVNSLMDSSSMALLVTGDIDASSSRATSMVNAINSNLSHDTYGIARYTGDTYYYTSQYDPAGNEAGAAEPVWPNMTMFDAIYDVQSGQSALALERLQYYASVSGVGYMPPGEAVAWPTSQPVLSTMSEPLTASAFILAALDYAGKYDSRVYASNANASDYASVNITTSPSGDWSKWTNIPYYAFPAGASSSGSAMTNIGDVYISNDASNIYVRVDNSSGAFSAYGASPKFALLVYAQDFNHSGSLTGTTSGEYGRTLDHSMNYMVGRWSDSNSYSAFSASTSGWTSTGNLSSIAPQWDTATGRIEAAIPISSLASGGSAATGAWSYLDVELAYQNPSTGTWSDDDLGAIHYELAGSASTTLYGNVTR